MKPSAEIKAIRNAIQRCYNPSYRGYRYYGGRGITVCDEWRNDQAAFVEYMGPRPKGYSLDRIDNDKGYEPGNVRWASKTTQATNRSSTKFLTLAGLTLSLKEWSHRLGAASQTIYSRSAVNWSTERILLTPFSNGATTLAQLTLEHLHASNTPWPNFAPAE